MMQDPDNPGTWHGDFYDGKWKTPPKRDEALIDRLVSAIYQKFRANAHKGGWRHLSDSEIHDMLQNEIGELVDAVESGDAQNAIMEAADVAIFASFYADPGRKHE